MVDKAQTVLENTNKYITWWFNQVPSGSLFELRIKDNINKSAPPEQYWFNDVASVMNFLGRYSTTNKHIWYGLQPRAKSGGSNEDVLKIIFKAPDLDYINHNIITPQKEYDLIERWAKYPTYHILKNSDMTFAIVGSGNGVQIIAKLKSPLDNTKENRELNKTETITLGNDLLRINPNKELVVDEVKDAARVLRLPGFANPKGERVAELWECETASISTTSSEASFKPHSFKGLDNALKTKINDAGRYNHFLTILGITASMRIPRVAAEAMLREFNIKNCTPVAPDYYITNAMTDYDDWLINNSAFTATEEKKEMPFEPKVRKTSDFAPILATPRKFYVGRYIPEKSLCEIIGRMGEKKSVAMLDMALAITSGRKWLNEFETEKIGVLIVDEENGEWEFARRFELLKRDGENYDLLNWMSMESLQLNEEKHQQWFRAYLTAHPEIKIVMCDSFRRIATIEENDSKEITAFLNGVLKKIITDFGIAIILLHHLRKRDKKAASQSIDMEDARGSGDIGAMADSILSIQTVKDTDDKQFLLTHEKSRCGRKTPPQNVLFSVSEEKNDAGDDIHAELICIGENTADEGQIITTANAIMKWWPGGVQKRKAIANSMEPLHHDVTAVDRALKYLKTVKKLGLSEGKAGQYIKLESITDDNQEVINSIISEIKEHKIRTIDQLISLAICEEKQLRQIIFKMKDMGDIAEVKPGAYILGISKQGEDVPESIMATCVKCHKENQVCRLNLDKERICKGCEYLEGVKNENLS